MVDSKKHNARVFVRRSQMMQEPSEEAETAWESSARILMHQMRPLCSFSEASIVCVCRPILQTR